MNKINAKIDKAQEKITLVGEKYDTKYTRKAILVALGAGFILGFLVKAMIF